ncbi:uncharacterized protein LOC136086281 [Hydra vulgaris]|uniref:Uncharacterized protein LOC136086281 n=1 Tax=Hydra vulgaris TaxID=6087 RepID=A0ABM4CRZ4_HYDVU
MLYERWAFLYTESKGFTFVLSPIYGSDDMIGSDKLDTLKQIEKYYHCNNSNITGNMFNDNSEIEMDNIRLKEVINVNANRQLENSCYQDEDDEAGSVEDDKTDLHKGDETGSVEDDEAGSVEDDKTDLHKGDETGSVEDDEAGSGEDDEAG